MDFNRDFHRAAHRKAVQHGLDTQAARHVAGLHILNAGHGLGRVASRKNLVSDVVDFLSVGIDAGRGQLIVVPHGQEHVVQFRNAARAVAGQTCTSSRSASSEVLDVRAGAGSPGVIQEAVIAVSVLRVVGGNRGAGLRGGNGVGGQNVAVDGGDGLQVDAMAWCRGDRVSW